ncbi:uncharacterized protein MONBRDRAFT_22347 [Monosiga brevicollis MX1]|uniref:Uncharacterized protein n=1 Tax=Monosiga brevicollis TaxID=81824 RepID=A9UQB3_MONBE|nr:uncharacterized protein MONBRDRAFT_22347 [Monosiga brevicollis MX1]EDQ93018.1 predicted protein [Monosiga brevicollis MX1]|eukprot:XP_001742780.1 hypothetical protein [Monosiga brevicollis MX1]
MPPVGENGILYDVVESIYTPGLNGGVVIVLAAILLVLFMVNVFLLVVVGPNIHVIVLLCLTVILSGLMIWVIPQITEAQNNAKKEQTGSEAESSDKPSEDTTESKKDN